MKFSGSKLVSGDWSSHRHLHSTPNTLLTLENQNDSQRRSQKIVQRDERRPDLSWQTNLLLCEVIVQLRHLNATASALLQVPDVTLRDTPRTDP